MITPPMSREEIQAVLDAGGEITFAPGVYENAHYRLSKPTHLRGEGALLVGGRKITWQEENGLLTCTVNAPLPLRNLVVDGDLRAVCRLPKQGYFQHETEFDVRWMSTTGGGWQRKPTHEELTTMRVPHDSLANLTLTSAEATVKHSWDESMLTVRSVEGDTITFLQEGGHPVGGFGVKDYCLWNLPEAFTEPGTFYHDVSAGKLYYRPLEGESAATEAYLPTEESIFFAETAISQVEIEGFSFIATDTPRIAAGFGAGNMPGALHFPRLTESCIHHVTIRAVGGYGIQIPEYAENLRIHHCNICHTGAGGIRVFQKNAPDAPISNEIAHCRVEHDGFTYASAIGIHSTACHVRHNEIAYTSYSGIAANGDHIVIEGNIIHHAMSVLDDGAAFYSFGAQYGILRKNLVHHIQPRPGHNGRSAYYLDEISKGWIVEENVALECPRPNHNHMCGDHLYRRNLFVNRSGDMLFSMHNPASGNRYEDNAFLTAGEIILSTPEMGIASFCRNRYHTASGGITWKVMEKYEDKGERPFPLEESNSLVSLEQFTPEQRNFRVGDLAIDLINSGIQPEDCR